MTANGTNKEREWAYKGIGCLFFACVLGALAIIIVLAVKADELTDQQGMWLGFLAAFLILLCVGVGFFGRALFWDEQEAGRHKLKQGRKPSRLGRFLWLNLPPLVFGGIVFTVIYCDRGFTPALLGIVLGLAARAVLSRMIAYQDALADQLVALGLEVKQEMVGAQTFYAEGVYNERKARVRVVTETAQEKGVKPIPYDSERQDFQRNYGYCGDNYEDPNDPDKTTTYRIIIEVECKDKLSVFTVRHRQGKVLEKLRAEGLARGGLQLPSPRDYWLDNVNRKGLAAALIKHHTPLLERILPQSEMLGLNFIFAVADTGEPETFFDIPGVMVSVSHAIPVGWTFEGATSKDRYSKKQPTFSDLFDWSSLRPFRVFSSSAPDFSYLKQTMDDMISLCEYVEQLTEPAKQKKAD